jgi:hypothetical protein
MFMRPDRTSITIGVPAVLEENASYTSKSIALNLFGVG